MKYAVNTDLTHWDNQQLLKHIRALLFQAEIKQRWARCIKPVLSLDTIFQLLIKDLIIINKNNLSQSGLFLLSITNQLNQPSLIWYPSRILIKAKETNKDLYYKALKQGSWINLKSQVIHYQIRLNNLWAHLLIGISYWMIT